MAQTPGERVGPYEIRGAIGVGGMGAVYRAYDPRLRRDVALKFLHPSEGDNTSRALLLHEARAASALNHPGICTVYDVGEDADSPYIAMEYLEGDSLDRQIPAGGLPPEVVIRYGIQIADALAHAHSRGIVHRDLKPGNVVASKDGRLKVLDFGLARSDSAVSALTTRAQTTGQVDESIAGTLAYMAPEVLRGEPADERSDLWALGVLLHQLASGELPFRGAATPRLISAILEQPPASLPGRVPSGLQTTIGRLLSRDPAQRYRSAGEVRAVLESQHAGSTAHSPSPAREPRRRQRIQPRLAAVAVAACLGLAAWLLLRALGGPSALQLRDQALLSTFAGTHRGPTLSPRADLVAFEAPDQAGVSQIWVKDLGQGAAIQITSGDIPAGRPRWSPAGDQVLFNRAGQGIWSIAPLGGGSRRVVENGSNASFSRDGRRILYEWQNRIWMADADGSNARMLDWIPGKYYSVPADPAWSPDGRWIAYFRPEAGPNGDLWIAPTDGGEPRQLTFDMREGGAPVWLPDSARIVFSSARAGSRTLWITHINGGEPLPLTTGAGEDDQPEISLDGTRLVYTNVKHTWELQIRDSDDAADRILLEKRTEINFPMFSPDGSRLTFFGREGRAVAIFTIEIDGSNLRQLTGGTELNHQPRWSADGSWVYFYQIAPGLAFRRVPVDGGPTEEVFPWRWETHNAIQFSPDGHKLVYVRRPEATIVRDLRTGVEHPLGGGALTFPRWAPGGKLVAGSAGGRVQMCPADGSACTDIAGGYFPTFGRDDTRVYFLRSGSARDVHQVWSSDLDGNDPRNHGDVGPFRGTLDLFYDVSSRGAIVWAPYREGRYELWVATLE